MIFVLTGLDTAAARAEESEAIVNWAFRQFAQRTLATAGQRLAVADVWEGAEPQVGLVPAEDISVLIPVLAGREVAAEVVYTGPIQAPVAAGTPLAELVLQPEGLPEQRFALVAETDVPHGGFLARISTAALSLIQTVRATPATEEGV